MKIVSQNGREDELVVDMYLPNLIKGDKGDKGRDGIDGVDGIDGEPLLVELEKAVSFVKVDEEGNVLENELGIEGRSTVELAIGSVDNYYRTYHLYKYDLKTEHGKVEADYYRYTVDGVVHTGPFRVYAVEFDEGSDVIECKVHLQLKSNVYRSPIYHAYKCIVFKKDYPFPGNAKSFSGMFEQVVADVLKDEVVEEEIV